VQLDGPLEPVSGTQYTIGVDLGLKHDRSVASVCHGEPSGDGVRVVLDRMQVWQGTRSRPVDLTAVEEWLLEVGLRFNRARIVIDPYQGIGLAQRLRRGGLRVEEYAFSQQSVGRLAIALHTAIRDHRLMLPDDEALIDELANVRLRETSPGVLRMDHDPDRHDDRAISLSLAVHHLAEAGLGASVGWITYYRQVIAQRAEEPARQAEELRRLQNSIEQNVLRTGCRHRFQKTSAESPYYCVFCGGQQEQAA
jgi:phage FluMu gp28-like protein